MIKKTITSIDFDGKERTEDFYFHLTEQELTEWEFSIDGGMSGVLTRLMQTEDKKTIVRLIKEIIMKSYGVKTPDGRGFVKNEKVLSDFMSTQAFSDLYMELALDDKAASEFVNGVLPASLMTQAKEQLKVVD